LKYRKVYNDYWLLYREYYNSKSDKN
jgi:hypothetical protein